MTTPKTIICIGDTQAKPGVPTDHMTWIGHYLVDQFGGRDDVAVVHLGDHADMPSLSMYDKGKRAMEGRRYKADIKAANKAWARLNAPLVEYNRQRAKTRHRQWWPERHILLGNHEARITRACDADAQLDGVLSLDDLDYARTGWQVHPFLSVLWLQGIAFSHYFYHPSTGRPYGGESLDTRLKQVGHSFVMGHQQGLKMSMRTVGSTRHQGLVNGSCYLHEEDYLGPQAKAYWRGIVVLHQAEAGTWDPMCVSLDYLCRRYEGVRLEEFMAGKTKEKAA